MAFNKIKTLGRKTFEEFRQLSGQVKAGVQNLGEMSMGGFTSLVEKAMPSRVIEVHNEAKSTPLKIAKGTNYDPLHADQTKLRPDGKGAAGVLMTPKMIAVSRKGPNSSEPILPYGTIVETEEGERFLVADIKNRRFHSDFEFDFARPGSGSNIIPELNREFKFKVLELGKGIQDAREKAKNFQ
jgi:hypothetical protein